MCDEVNLSPNQKCVQFKRKRIHMDTAACMDLAQTSESVVTLSDPLALPVNKDVNRGLYPIIRNKRRRMANSIEMENVMDKETSNFDNVPRLNCFQSSQGFVSASKMYDIHSQTTPLIPDNSKTFFQNSQSLKKGKQIKQIANQKSLDSFFPSSTSSASSSVSCKERTVAHNSSPSTSSLMYSPIKKLSPGDNKTCIYISDDNSSSPCSSYSSSQGNSQKVKISDNSVVKHLFDAAKNFNPKVKPKRKNVEATGSSVFKSKERNTKYDGVKYFDSDSFDLNTAFDSDMDDATLSGNVDSNTGKDTVKSGKDKYGLLGSGSYPKKEKVNYFERLPPEVLENIFCQLPLLDLCLNSNRVCSQWNSIIADEKV